MRRNRHIKWIFSGIIAITVILVLNGLFNNLITIESYSKSGVSKDYSFNGKTSRNVVALNKYNNIDSIQIHFNKEKDCIVLSGDFVRLDTTSQITLEDSVQFTVPKGWQFVPDTLGVNYYFDETIYSQNNTIKPFEFEYSLAVYTGTNYSKMSLEIEEQVHRIQESFPLVSIIDSASFNGIKIGTTKFIYGEPKERIIVNKKYIFRGGLFYIFSIRVREEYYSLIDDFVDILFMHIKTVDSGSIVPSK
ncbi:hypothetical protein [Mangrovibacterium lignilyticum]|uniref:hypothetical protein n=1 Tax=Mangrovibacterium lignilyticum TaxID=2668052 RepID=UPI0013D603C6|nr:hypothetical protein [Mangrovibacterium lignilyticum]